MNYWLFTCNPVSYPTVFEEMEKSAINRWSVSTHIQEIQVGDKVAFWIGGKNDPGIYMFSEVSSLPHKAKHYQFPDKTISYVRLANSKSFPLHPITYETLRLESSFTQILRNIRSPHRSPVKLTATNWKFLVSAQKKANKGGKSPSLKVLSEDAISKVITTEEKRIEKKYFNRPTERKSLITSRLGQGRYRANLRRVEKACRITGIADPSFLVASHIKPWVVSTDKEKLDGNNGLLLTPNLDRAFDRGYISFSSSGKILISKRISNAILKLLGINASTKIGPLNFGQQRYMKYHRDKVFKK